MNVNVNVNEDSEGGRSRDFYIISYLSISPHTAVS